MSFTNQLTDNRYVKFDGNFLWRQFTPNLKKNPQKNSVEAVPAKSQKESTKKFCGASSRQISKRIRPKILWRQFPPISKRKKKYEIKPYLFAPLN